MDAFLLSRLQSCGWGSYFFSVFLLCSFLVAYPCAGSIVDQELIYLSVLPNFNRLAP